MAHIPIEEKNRSSWLPWILGLAVLLLVGWGIAELVDEEIEEVEPYAAEIEAAPIESDIDVGTPVDVITVANVITEADNQMDLAGRDVMLSDMRVTRVVGDKTFYVVPQGMQNAEELLIVLDQVPTPGQPGVEGRYDVTAGQIMTIEGELRELDVDPVEEWQLTEAEAQTLSSDEIYVHADQLDIQ